MRTTLVVQLVVVYLVFCLPWTVVGFLASTRKIIPIQTAVRKLPTTTIINNNNKSTINRQQQQQQQHDYHHDVVNYPFHNMNRLYSMRSKMDHDIDNSNNYGDDGSSKKSTTTSSGSNNQTESTTFISSSNSNRTVVKKENNDKNNKNDQYHSSTTDLLNHKVDKKQVEENNATIIHPSKTVTATATTTAAAAAAAVAAYRDELEQATTSSSSPYPYNRNRSTTTSTMDDTTNYNYNIDDEECMVGDSCSLIDYHYQGDVSYQFQLDLVVERTIIWGPILFPLLAYYLYDPIAALFAIIIDILNFGNTWIAVDGGTYQATIIAPAINGIIIPSISLLFANLITNTVTTLRQRQLQIHGAINAEAGQIRRLSHLLDAFPTTTSTSTSTTTPQQQQQEKGTTTTTTTTTPPQITTTTATSTISAQDKCRIYLLKYTSRLIAEGHESVNVNSLDLSGMDSELNGIMTELNHYSYHVASAAAATSTTTTTAASISSPSDATSSTSTPTTPVVASTIIIKQSYDAVRQLLQERSKRITAFQSTFPPLHYAIVTALAVSILVAFLMETNQELLVFLNAVQLRILWTMLVATFCALAAVCYDLGNPFRGHYMISHSLDQLYTIRLALRSSLEQHEYHEKIITTTSTTMTTAIPNIINNDSNTSTEATTTTGATVARGMIAGGYPKETNKIDDDDDDENCKDFTTAKMDNHQNKKHWQY